MALAGPAASLSLPSPGSEGSALFAMGAARVPAVGGPVASAQAVPSARGVLGAGGGGIRLLLLLLLGAAAVYQRFSQGRIPGRCQVDHGVGSPPVPELLAFPSVLEACVVSYSTIV